MQRLWLFAVLALTVFSVQARMMPGEQIQNLLQPWPPRGWTTTMTLPDETHPHEAESRLGPGYFGQALYRHIAGTSDYWTANVLVRDRISPASAWRAVSAVSCKSRNYYGHRARECSRGDRHYFTKTLHYEIDRFYITIQVSGPGNTEYPEVLLHADGGARGAPPAWAKELENRPGRLF